MTDLLFSQRDRQSIIDDVQKTSGRPQGQPILGWDAVPGMDSIGRASAAIRVGVAQSALDLAEFTPVSREEWDRRYAELVDARQNYEARLPREQDRSLAGEIVRGVVEPLLPLVAGGAVGGPAGAAIGYGGAYAVGNAPGSIAARKNIDPQYNVFDPPGSVSALYEEETASRAGMISGVSMVAGALAPAAIGSTLAQRVASGAAVNAGFGVAERYATGEYLRSRGYEDAAQLYDPLDPLALGIDVILGGAFGGVHHYYASRGQAPSDAIPPEWEPLVQARADAYVRDGGMTPDAARAAAEEDAREAPELIGAPTPEPDEVAAALVTLDRLRDAQSGPGIPTTLAGRYAHQDALELAQRQMEADEAVDVTPALRDVSEQDYAPPQPRDAPEVDDAITGALREAGFDDAIEELRAAAAAARSAGEQARARGVDLGPDDGPMFSRRISAPTWRGIGSRHGRYEARDLILAANDGVTDGEIGDSFQTNPDVISVEISTVRRQIREEMGADPGARRRILAELNISGEELDAFLDPQGRRLPPSASREIRKLIRQGVPNAKAAIPLLRDAANRLRFDMPAESSVPAMWSMQKKVLKQRPDVMFARSLDAMGFYSPVFEAAKGVPDNIWKMGWQAVRNAIEKDKTAKAEGARVREEIKAIGLDEAFKDSKLRGAELKAAVEAHLATWRIVLNVDQAVFDPRNPPEGIVSPPMRKKEWLEGADAKALTLADVEFREARDSTIPPYTKADGSTDSTYAVRFVTPYKINRPVEIYRAKGAQEWTVRVGFWAGEHEEMGPFATREEAEFVATLAFKSENADQILRHVKAEDINADEGRFNPRTERFNDNTWTVQDQMAGAITIAKVGDQYSLFDGWRMWDAATRGPALATFPTAEAARADARARLREQWVRDNADPRDIEDAANISRSFDDIRLPGGESLYETVVYYSGPLPGADFQAPETHIGGKTRRSDGGSEGTIFTLHGEVRTDDKGQRTLSVSQLQSDLAQQIRAGKDDVVRLDKEIANLLDAVAGMSKDDVALVLADGTTRMFPSMQDASTAALSLPDARGMFGRDGLLRYADRLQNDLDVTRQDVSEIEGAPLTAKTSQWTLGGVRALVYRAALEGFQSVAFPTAMTSEAIQGNAKAASHYTENVRPALEKVARAFGGEVRRGTVDAPGWIEDLSRYLNARVEADPSGNGDWLILREEGGLLRRYNSEDFARRDLAYKQERARAQIGLSPDRAPMFVMDITPEMRALILQRGMPMFARGEGPGSTVADIEATARAAFGKDSAKLLDDAKVSVVQSVADLPADVREALESAGLNGTEKALAYKGRAYIIADAVNPQEIPGLLLHEVGVHLGLKKMLGSEAYGITLDQIERMIDAGDARVIEARRIAEANAAKPSHVAEETLAYLVQNEPELPLVRRLLARLRQWVYRTIGYRFGQELSVEDLREMAVASLRRYAREANQVEVVGPGAPRPQALPARYADMTPKAFADWARSDDVVVAQSFDEPGTFYGFAVQSVARDGSVIDDAITLRVTDRGNGVMDLNWDWVKNDLEADSFKPRYEMTPKEALRILAQVGALVEREITEHQGSAYTWQPATDILGTMYDRLVGAVADKLGYRVVQMRGNEKALVHPAAEINERTGELLRENPDEVIRPEIDDAERERARAAYFAALEAATDAQSRSNGRGGGGNDGGTGGDGPKFARAFDPLAETLKENPGLTLPNGASAEAAVRVARANRVKAEAMGQAFQTAASCALKNGFGPRTALRVAEMQAGLTAGAVGGGVFANSAIPLMRQAAFEETEIARMEALNAEIEGRLDGLIFDPERPLTSQEQRVVGFYDDPEDEGVRPGDAFTAGSASGRVGYVEPAGAPQ